MDDLDGDDVDILRTPFLCCGNSYRIILLEVSNEDHVSA